jgi:hypothetical protein
MRPSYDAHSELAILDGPAPGAIASETASAIALDKCPHIISKFFHPFVPRLAMVELASNRFGVPENNMGTDRSIH